MGNCASLRETHWTDSERAGLESSRKLPPENYQKIYGYSLSSTFLGEGGVLMGRGGLWAMVDPGKGLELETELIPVQGVQARVPDVIHSELWQDT